MRTYYMELLLHYYLLVEEYVVAANTYLLA